MDQPSAGPTPNLFDGIGPFVERVSWVSDARQGPSRPVFGVFRDDFSLSVRLGFAPSHHVKAVRADDSSFLRPLRLHGTACAKRRFQRLLQPTPQKRAGQSVQGACSAPEKRTGGASCTTFAWR